MTCRTRCGMSPVRAHAHRMPVDTCTLVLLWCCVRRCVRIGTTLQVADFGTARLVTSARSRLRTVEAETGFGAGEAMPIALTATMTRGVGTPLWMAPELFEGGSSYGPEVDVCKDIDTSAVHLEPASPTPPLVTYWHWSLAIRKRALPTTAHIPPAHTVWLTRSRRRPLRSPSLPRRQLRCHPVGAPDPTGAVGRSDQGHRILQVLHQAHRRARGRPPATDRPGRRRRAPAVRGPHREVLANRRVRPPKVSTRPGVLHAGRSRQNRALSLHRWDPASGGAGEVLAGETCTRVVSTREQPIASTHLVCRPIYLGSLAFAL